MDRLGKLGAGVWSYEGGPGEGDVVVGLPLFIPRFCICCVGGGGEVVLLAAGAGLSRAAVVDVLPFVVRRGPERGDSCGRAAWIWSKTASSMTPFSRRFSSSW